ncbi:MAG: hypothetical protein A3D31_17050 [Candidatus Fluviicola riflensis]|nr:MAG: hypothetical protein CHH17_01990 [Candidatus Fluviicola riflensis]OGS76696.1 MAG: hypothetical protein A3D31_17050 [Candidatus Fluviicola riflensis]OGS82949.1 MAG: hypothetical protein A2724_14310 [Fluviicola sp. RIFCSPHIGHO2_01_FULL_43_53]OGS88427.1 MAG: hypothetical protein A3E30_06555 [Fluviicola sp. RIFCSPHIGHO2_12_FULL_43_24]
MKIMLLLLVVLSGTLFCSCESEYNKQLNQAKNLVEEELEIRASIRYAGDKTRYFEQTLNELDETINFHAHLSGNKEVFLNELNGYKSKLLLDSNVDKEILISKYP